MPQQIDKKNIPPKIHVFSNFVKNRKLSKNENNKMEILGTFKIGRANNNYVIV